MAYSMGAAMALCLRCAVVARDQLNAVMTIRAVKTVFVQPLLGKEPDERIGENDVGV